jgi:hypothetical protein
MSKQYPAGIISKNAVVPAGPYQTGAASGIWTMDQQAYWNKQGLWPIAGNVERDNYFKYVTMLLHGDGANGAQNSTFLDSSPNNYTVTLTNTVSQGSFSPYGTTWSNYFDGSTGFLSMTGSSSTNFSGVDWTIETWVYSNGAPPADYTYIIQSQTGTNNWLPYLGISLMVNGTINCAINGVNYTSTQTISFNAWNHLALVRSGGVIKLYINGVASSVSVTADIVNSNLSFWFGKVDNAPGGGGYLYYFNGYLSNTRFVKGTAVYTSSFTPSTTPLTAITNTTLLINQSNRHIDNSSSAYTITPTGSVYVQRFSPFAPTAAYSPSTTGGSGRFDGTSGWLRIQSSGGTAIGTSDFTLEFWFYPLNGSVTQIEYRPPSTNGAYLTLGIIAGSTIELTVNNAAQISAGFGPPSNAWSHIAISRVSGNTRLFYNGVQAGSTWADSTNYAAANGNLWWNAFIGVRPCQGYISGYRLATTGLYSSTFTPPSTPPTAITNTQQLLNFTNAGIVDSSANFDLRTVGNAAITTSTYKYGTGSISFDGSGYLYSRALPNPNVALRTGDFTVEAWINTNTLTGERGFIQTSATAGGLQTSYTDGIIGVIVAGAGSYTISMNVGGTNVVGSTAITTGTWYHIALTRSSGSVRLFINGVLSSGPTTITADLTGQYICVGGYYNTSYLWNGYIDDLRITKGVARYTATFTPPVKAFIDL